MKQWIYTLMAFVVAACIVCIVGEAPQAGGSGGGIGDATHRYRKVMFRASGYVITDADSVRFLSYANNLVAADGDTAGEGNRWYYSTVDSVHWYADNVEHWPQNFYIYHGTIAAAGSLLTAYTNTPIVGRTAGRNFIADSSAIAQNVIYREHLTNDCVGPSEVDDSGAYTMASLVAPGLGTDALNTYTAGKLDIQAIVRDLDADTLATDSLTVDGPVYIKEQADASADHAGYGQLWVNLATPNELWWTDDAGTDAQLAVTGSGDITAVTAGEGLGGGGVSGAVTLTANLDHDGGIESVDDSLNIKLDGASLTLGTAGLKVTTPGGSTAYDDIGDPDADATIAFTGYEQDITSTLDVAQHTVWTVNHTPAAITNQVYLAELSYNSSDDFSGSYLRCIDDADGTPTVEFEIDKGGVVTLPANGGFVGGGDLYFLAVSQMQFQAAADQSDYLTLDVTADVIQLGTAASGNGDLEIASGGGDITMMDDLHVGADDAAETLEIHDAGTLKLWDLSDNTSVTFGPVGDGTTVLGVTGTINATGLQVGGVAVQTGTDDDVPEAGDFGAATDLDANGALNTGSVDANEIVSTAVTPASYTLTSLTVDADGRLTAASTGSEADPTVDTADEIEAILTNDPCDFGSGLVSGTGYDASDGNITNVGQIDVDLVDADGVALVIGDNDETIAINSSDWDISTTGDMTGIGAITATGAVDFSDGTLEIPNGTDPDVTVLGQVSFDTDDYTVRASDGTNQVAVGQKIHTYRFCVMTPNDLSDANRDKAFFWDNASGLTFTITEIRAWADTDDTAFQIEEYDADGASNESLVDALNCTTGTGPYTVTETTISGPTIEAGHTLCADFDDADTPGQVFISFDGWYNADVD